MISANLVAQRIKLKRITGFRLPIVRESEEDAATGYDFPIKHEIQNSLKNPGLRPPFGVGTSYRNRLSQELPETID